MAKKIIRKETAACETLQEWLNRQDLANGYTIANAKFRRDFNRVSAELKKRAKKLYVLSISMEMWSMTQMMRSAKKQSRFCAMVANKLATRKVELDHTALFESEVKKLDERLHRIDLIIDENVRLTKYAPFFASDAFDDESVDFEELPWLAEKWNEEHAEEVEAHLAEVAPEIERHESFVRQRNETIRIEKATERKLIQKAKEEARQARKAHAEDLARRREAEEEHHRMRFGQRA